MSSSTMARSAWKLSASPLARSAAARSSSSLILARKISTSHVASIVRCVRSCRGRSKPESARLRGVRPARGEGEGADRALEPLESGAQVVPQRVALISLDEPQDDLLEALGRLGVRLRRLDELARREVRVGLGGEDGVTLTLRLRARDIRSA